LYWNWYIFTKLLVVTFCLQRNIYIIVQFYNVHVTIVVSIIKVNTKTTYMMTKMMTKMTKTMMMKMMTKMTKMMVSENQPS